MPIVLPSPIDIVSYLSVPLPLLGLSRYIERVSLVVRIRLTALRGE